MSSNIIVVAVGGLGGILPHGSIGQCSVECTQQTVQCTLAVYWQFMP